MRFFSQAPVIFALAFTILVSAPVRAARFEIEATPVGPNDADARQLAREVLLRPELASRLEGKKYRVLETNIEDDVTDPFKDGFADNHRFSMSIYDYTSDRLLTVAASIGNPSILKVDESDEAPPATDEEYQEALSKLQMDPVIGPTLALGLWSPAPAMPPVIERNASLTSPGRTVPVALLSRSARAPHEIVGVNLRTGEVIRYPNHAPPEAIATARTCGPRSAGQKSTGKGITGTSKIVVKRSGEEIWNLTAIRPSSSSGANGSGIELRDVRYKGRLLLRRLHMPILNVRYKGDKCGPYRDWAWAENPFRASGKTLAPGFVQTATRPKTVADNDDDYGTFRGVAVHEEGREVVLTTELSASWYRYVLEYRLHDDGTIRPRIEFAAVENSCVCYSHLHNAYWRMDFDIDQSEPNRIETKTSSGWRLVEKEEVQNRGSSALAWRVSNPSTGHAYIVEPGEADGSADSFGKADAWILAYHGNEIDDSRVRGSSKAAALTNFVNRESTVDHDLVFWYGTHFLHEHDDISAFTVSGPTIRPDNL